MRMVGIAARMGLLRQLGLSITATVVATMIISGIRGEVAWLRGTAVQSSPDLTSGGKFAARVQTLRESKVEPTIALPMPVLAADAAFRAFPVSFSSTDTGGASLPKDAPRGPKRVAHADARHHPTAEEARNVLPPKRGENVADTAPAPALAVAMETPSHDGFWSVTRSLTGRTLAFGENALDKLNPLNLIP